MLKEKENPINKSFKIQTRFPFCLVWTALPCITTIFPLIGHTGVCSSDGIIHDFGGSNYIAIDNFTFGSPLKYVLLKIDGNKKNEWDKAVHEADEKFSGKKHEIISNNCHHHVAEVLNGIEYNGRKNWGFFDIWWLFLTKGKYVSYYSIIKTQWLYIIIMISLILILTLYFNLN